MCTATRVRPSLRSITTLTRHTRAASRPKRPTRHRIEWIAPLESRLLLSQAPLLSPLLTPANTAPTIDELNTLLGPTEGHTDPFAISFDQLLAQGNLALADPDPGQTLRLLISQTGVGSLTKDGAPVVPGQTTLGPGESLLWTPPSSSRDCYTIAQVRAFDGIAASSATAPLKLIVTPAGNPNLEALPGQGLNALHYNPVTDQFVRLLVKKNDAASSDASLLYQQLQPDGTWSSETISSTILEFNWTTPWKYLTSDAQLLLDSQGSPHVLFTAQYPVPTWQDTQGISHDVRTSVWHFTRVNGTWTRAESIDFPTPIGAEEAHLFTAALGPDDSLHLALTSGAAIEGTTFEAQSGSVAYPVWTANNIGGAWTWQNTGLSAAWQEISYHEYYAWRSFSLAVDANNADHLSYCPMFHLESNPDSSVRPYSELWYASNASGVWTSSRVARPPDNSGDAGRGASIAIDPPTNRPVIAAWLVDRTTSGSATTSSLLYLVQSAAGAWSSSTLSSSADGYLASDGNRGSGFAPFLQFDSRGRAHLLFSDLAAAPSATGQLQFAGQIRHALWNGAAWKIDTLYRQSDPTTNQMIYPAFALSPNSLLVDGLAEWDATADATAHWIEASFFNLVEVTSPLFTVSLEQTPGQSDPCPAGAVAFTVTFSDAVSDFSPQDVLLSGTAGASNIRFLSAQAGALRPSTGNLASFFDEAYYLAHNPDVAAAVAQKRLPSGWAHFLAAGQYEGRRPSALYDDAWYLANNPDIAAAVNAGALKSGFQHFARAGFAEGRRAAAPADFRFSAFTFAVTGMTQSGTVSAVIPPDAVHDLLNTPSPLSTSSDNTVFYTTLRPVSGNPRSFFDERYYLAANPDIDLAVNRGKFTSGWAHFLALGQFEGRAPSELFNEAWYRARYPDIAAAIKAGVLKNGFQHFVRSGFAEGRAGIAAPPDLSAIGASAPTLIPVTGIMRSFFDEGWYLASNPDVAAAVNAGSLASGWQHFLLRGRREGRRPSRLYAESAYLAHNPDVAALVSAGYLPDGFAHFIRAGYAEGRIALA